MLSRSIAILVGTWLPMLAVILPLGPVHTANAIVAGIVATLLSFAALADDRARIGAAVVGGWVALSPFIFASTLMEEVLTVSWGVTMLVCMIGPLSQAPHVAVVRAPEREVGSVAEAEDAAFARAA